MAKKVDTLTIEMTADGFTFVQVPDWGLPEWLKFSLARADMSSLDMAEYLGVSTTTITNWTSGRIKPGVASMRAWAERTGIPYEWLAAGGATVYVRDSEAAAAAGVRHQGLEPRTRWLRASDPAADAGAALAPVLPFYPRRRAS